MHAVSVFPVPPFGPRMQIIGASATPVPLAVPCLRTTAFSNVKATCSGLSGRLMMSSAPTSNTRFTKPFGEPAESTTTGRSGRCFTAPSIR